MTWDNTIIQVNNMYISVKSRPPCPPSCRPTCPPPCQPPCPPLGTFNIAWSISFVPVPLWTFDIVYWTLSNIPISLGTFDIVWSLSFVPDAFKRLDTYWRDIWHFPGNVICPRDNGLVWTLERRMVWFGHSRGVWSGLDTREMYEVAWIYFIIDGLVLFTREM